MSETRRFIVHPQIIHNLVVAQAGSLGKAVLECVMNSVDAHATRVDIRVDSKRILIQDDGQGFRSKAEIAEWFDVFGFPHTEGDRVYGQFGIGRAQLWSFCSTLWRTGTFQMDVDIKQRGMDYQLLEGLDPVQGVRIEGIFYTALLTSELAAFEKELTDLALYAQIPVTINGRRINRDPTQAKWDFDTPEAWVKTSEVGLLAVYNLGVLVRRYPAYQFGCGGTVVTKPGVRLAVNMARNDILVAECPVWKRIRRVLQTRSDERVRTKTTRLTDHELENLAKRFVAGELDYAAVASIKLISDIVGRGHTLADFLMGPRSLRPLTTAEIGSRLGERAHARALAFVVSPHTLERFGATSVKDLLSLLGSALAKESATWLRDRLGRMQVIEDLASAVPTLSEGHIVLKDNELSKKDKAAVQALGVMAMQISHALAASKIVSHRTGYRRVSLGVSDVAEAWTDGQSEIFVERKQLRLMNDGIGGFMGLATLLVHELLHDSMDVGSHTHDHEFYARYHDATCGQAGVLRQAVIRGLQKWVSALHACGLRVPKAVVAHLDEVERVMREAAQSPD